MRAAHLLLVVLLVVAVALPCFGAEKKRHHRRLHHHRKVNPDEAGYQDLNRDDKMAALWDKVGTNYDPSHPRTYATVPQGLIGGTLRSGAVQGFAWSFNTTSDTMPKFWFSTRYKFIHPLGAVAKIAWRTVENPLGLTGLFAAHENIGLIRAGWAADPHAKKPANAVPGIAVKLLRDRLPSSNFMVMYSLDGQGSEPNMFANTLSNHLPDPKDSALVAGGKLFTMGTGTPWANRLGIESMATHTETGAAVDEPVSPWMLKFVPVPAMTERYAKLIEDASDPYSFRDAFYEIEEGTHLWDVYAVPYPEQGADHVCDTLERSVVGKHGDATQEYNDMLKAAEPVKVAEIVTTSPFASGEFGDDKLFFQHEFFCPRKNIVGYTRAHLMQTVLRFIHVIRHSGGMAPVDQHVVETHDVLEDESVPASVKASPDAWNWLW